MCCVSCKVPKLPMVKRKRERVPLWDEKNRPANDVPRDIYGRPLTSFAALTVRHGKNTAVK
jgi:hypothetical protein